MVSFCGRTGKEIEMKRLIVAAMLLAASGAALAMTVTCVFDNMMMVPTGEVKGSPNGLLREYRCAQGHTTWVKTS
jgi:hypothetical protein